MSQKRKRTVITLHEKLNALEKLDRGDSVLKVATEYGVGKVTVGDWQRNRQKIEQWCSNKAGCSGERKSMKKNHHEKVSEALFLWFTQQREKGVPISGPLLQAKAVAFYKDLATAEEEPFSASTGWLDRWKKRYGIRNLKICGEKLSSDQACASEFREEIKKIIKEENLSRHQLYNCDETGLNFKMLPRITLVYKEEQSAPGFKNSKERVTILACSNSSGSHKLRLMLIGKYAKPRALKNIAANTLPVYYKNQASAWMDSHLFHGWFCNEFVPSVEKFLKDNALPRKALLLIDNAPSHCKEEDLRSGDIKVKYLPPNVTSLIQPMDQGVLECLKRKYRRQLLESVIENMGEGSTLTECLKKINVKDVIYKVAAAWNDIQDSTLKNSWRKLLENIDANTDDADLSNSDEALLEVIISIPGCENTTLGELADWIKSDETHVLTDDEIIDEIRKPTCERIGSDDDAEEEDDHQGGDIVENRISHSDGLKSLHGALSYIEQQQDTTATDILVVKFLRDKAAKRKMQFLHQKTITDFFSKE